MTTPTITAPIPLLTVFTPPPDCYASTYTIGPDLITSVSTNNFTANYVSRGLRESCYPRSFLNMPWDDNQAYYSPGILPSGYVYNTGTVSSGITFVTGCPSNMGFDYNDSYTTADKTTVSWSEDCSSQGTVVVVSNSNTITVSANVYAPALVVAWESLDSAILFASTSFASPSIPLSTVGGTSASAAAAASATAGRPTSTAASSSSNITPSSSSAPAAGLSTGAKAGIGVGAAVGALAVLGGALFLLRRRKQGGTMKEEEGTRGEKARLSQEGAGFSHGGREVFSSADRKVANDEGLVHEVEGSGANLAQMDDDDGRYRAELPSDWRGWEAPADPAADKQAMERNAGHQKPA